MKTIIDYATFKAVVAKVISDTIQNGVYYPEHYDLSLRIALLVAYAPELEIDKLADNNELIEKVYSTEANEILATIGEQPQYEAIITAIDNGIAFSKQTILRAYNYSLTDNSLSELIDKINDILDNEDIKQSLVTLLSKINDTSLQKVMQLNNAKTLNTKVGDTNEEENLQKPKRSTKTTKKGHTKNPV